MLLMFDTRSRCSPTVAERLRTASRSTATSARRRSASARGCGAGGSDAMTPRYRPRRRGRATVSEGHAELQREDEGIVEVARRARIQDALDVGLEVEPRQHVDAVVQLEDHLVDLTRLTGRFLRAALRGAEM